MRKFMVVLCVLIMIGISVGANASTIIFNNFSDSSALTLNGSAMTVNNALRLTPAGSNQAGSAFITDSIHLEGDCSFSTNFEFQITNSGGLEGGADGLVFVIQSVGNSALGGHGGSIGYEGITSSVGIEFDTYNNPWDSDGNHIGINLDGSVDSVTTHNVPTSLNNGDVWYAWINLNETTDLMEVRLSDTNTRPIDAQLSYFIDLPSILDTSNVFAGFTSGTGAGHGDHDILSWQFDYNPVPIPGAIWLLGSGVICLVGLRRKLK